jgi:hypothetical protein
LVEFPQRGWCVGGGEQAGVDEVAIGRDLSTVIALVPSTGGVLVVDVHSVGHGAGGALSEPIDKPDIVMEEIKELNSDADSMVNRMNEEQSTFFYQLFQAAMHPEESFSHLFFPKGKAGRGKSFVVEALCMKLRAQALSVSSYPHGHMMHNLFKITVETVHILLFFGFALN